MRILILSEYYIYIDYSIIFFELVESSFIAVYFLVAY